MTKSIARTKAMKRTMSMIRGGKPFRLQILAIAILTGVTAFAEATYSYEEDGKAYVVTVPTNETETLSADAVAVLQANEITNFYKRGTGRLIMTSVTTNFTGHFWIEEGILTSFPQASSRSDNLTMGKIGAESSGCGAIHVKEGATFTVNGKNCTNSNGSSLDKTTYFGGTGYDGRGALTVLSGEARGHSFLNLWGKYLKMTSDALVCNDAGYYVGFAGYNGTLDMNSHTLTLNSSGNGVYEKIQVDSGSASRGRQERLGDVIIKTAALNMSCYANWFGYSNAYSNHTMTVKSGAKLILNHCQNSAHGCLALEDGATIQLNDAPRTEYNALDANLNTYHLWAGEVTAGTTKRIKITGASANRYLQFSGRVSGCGFYLEKGVRLILRAHPNATGTFSADTWANCFTGGVVATAGSDVTLLWGNLLPPTGDLVLSNSSFSVRNGLSYVLPAVRCSGTCKFLGRMDNIGYPGERENRQYYPTLQFYQGSIGQFSTNVAVSAFFGLPQIQPYPADTSATPVHPYLAVSTGPNQFLIDKTWTIDTADVVVGDCFRFAGGELKLSSGVKINIVGVGNRRAGMRRYKIAEAAAITFAGFKTVTIEDSLRWKFVVGDDGKSLYLDYIPNGIEITIR